MALTQAQKIAVRRHIGLPTASTAQSGRLAGWRFEEHFEDVEFRMNNFQPFEESLVTGNSIGSFRIDGRPTAGDSLQFKVSDSSGVNLTVPYTVLPSDANVNTAANGSPTFQVALGVAGAFGSQAVQSTGYQAVAVMPSDLFTAPFTNFPNYFSELVIIGSSYQTFGLTGTTLSGTTNLVVMAQGTQCPVQGSVDSVQCYGYLQILDQLAMQMIRADLSLTYRKADIVNFNPYEISVRNKLYETYRAQFLRFLGAEDYVRKFGGGARGGGGATA